MERVNEIGLRDDTGHRRFELLVDGEVAGFADHHVRDGAVVITHSEVDRRFRGRGLGSELARRTLDELRSRGVKVVPVCPFFARYVDEHHEYDDIVADL